MTASRPAHKPAFGYSSPRTSDQAYLPKKVLQKKATGTPGKAGVPKSPKSPNPEQPQGSSGKSSAAEDGTPVIPAPAKDTAIRPQCSNGKHTWDQVQDPGTGKWYCPTDPFPAEPEGPAA